MTTRFDVLTQQLFQKNIAECTVEELENLVQEHPYFAPAQYALLLKLKESNDTSYSAQFQKAILYYHDPLSFDKFINAENYQLDIADFQPAEALLPEETAIIAEPEIVTVEEHEPLEQEPEKESIANKEIKEEEIPNQEATDEGNEEIATQDIIAPELNNISAALTSEINPDQELVFEPYHTVDYFASQGIKLSQEEATKDKFGKQLKSFTEWLKTMKKLPAVEQVKALDDKSEKKVENLAAHSIEGEEVYTEAMAEVWARQGNREKAIEIYNKLSLLNPSKRAYFAAKIDSLK
jgi:DNA-binding SARP family transcriptional activator